MFIHFVKQIQDQTKYSQGIENGKHHAVAPEKLYLLPVASCHGTD